MWCLIFHRIHFSVKDFLAINMNVEVSGRPLWMGGGGGGGGDRVVRWCWVNFQCWGVLLIWIIVGQGPIVLALGAGGGCLDIFSLIYHFSSLSPSLWETARYRLVLSQRAVKPKSTNQPTTLDGVTEPF